MIQMAAMRFIPGALLMTSANSRPVGDVVRSRQLFEEADVTGWMRE
jgi:hypothetical protein